MDIAKKYRKLTPIQHVMKLPGMYIGGIDDIENTVYILRDEKEKPSVTEETIVYSPGLYKIFDELIVNAYDQTIRDSTVRNIKVTIDGDKNEISVYNDGKGIDIVMHPKEKIYVPELIFGHLRTSTTFEQDKPRITGGLHGLGAKLTAIFSKYFKVEVGDAKRKKKFVQIYKNNLSIKSKPQITPYKHNGYVKITYHPDLKYFKLKEINPDLISLMKRRVYDLAALTDKQVSVYLNGDKLPIQTFNHYVNLFTDNPQVSKQCFHDNGDKRWDIILTRSEGKFKQTSFVNGIYTSHGGKHVDYIMNQIVRLIKEKAEKKYKTKISPSFVRDQIHIFLSSVIENPTFPSQTKNELTTSISKFGSICALDDKLIKKIIGKLNLHETFQRYIKFMQSVAMTKTDVKKKSKVKGIKKLYDANFAGTKRAHLCTLILTEGDSAKTMAITGLSAIEKWNNFYGVFPLKGKPLNVREATHKQITTNETFLNIKKILGLKSNEVYTKDNINDLRYGSVMLMMDADVDGSHIKGLFINMLSFYWPSLLEMGFIKIFITPVVKVQKGKQIVSFYSLKDYEEWKSTVSMQQWKIHYYKGLGTNDDDEAKEYFRNLDKHVIKLNWVDKSKDAIELAFAKKRADDRKEWLKHYDKNDILDYTNKRITYYDFIHKELIHFSNYDNFRSIPKMADGLKPSQRKILYAAFKMNLKEKIKVSQFTGYIGKETSYHHGEISLAKTVIGMAQDFVGSNNIHLFLPNGQFGSRIMGGKDHSDPRYIFTNLNPITRLIFHKDDDPLLHYLDDDGYKIEPDYYVPIIPMVLINGIEGIGTGYRTNIPNFNPLDIINNLENRLKTKVKSFKQMKPWYRKFKGTIQKVEKNQYLAKGIYNKDKNNLLITELPVRTWTESYKGFVENDILDKPYVQSIVNNSNESNIDFVIKFKESKVLDGMIKDAEKLEKIFKLTTSLNLGNMHLYDRHGKIKRYQSVSEIMKDFFELRMEYYEKRKKYLLNKLKNELKYLSAKIKFITLVVKKEINLFNKTKKDIITILSKRNLPQVPNEPPYDYLIRMSFYSLTKEKIEELNKIYKDKKKEYTILKGQSPEQLYLTDLHNLRNKIVEIMDI